MSPIVARKWMKLTAGVILTLLLTVFLVGGTLIGWRFLFWSLFGPEARPLSERAFEQTPGRLARGRYLVEGVLRCFECHSEVEWDAPGVQPLPGRKGAGRELIEEGLLTRVFMPNITPDPETGAGNWTDDMLARAIREGVGHDGRALVPLMPYQNYRDMSDEDLAAVVVYLRSVPPLRNVVPRTELPFPLAVFSRGIPKPVTEPVLSPDLTDPVTRGQYLVRLGLCEGCHSSKDVSGRPMRFGGGSIVRGPWGSAAPTNITSDPSGIAYYNEAIFIETMRAGRVGGVRKLNSRMPWTTYRNLSNEDLKAIFVFLRTVQLVQHNVDNTTEPPTPCPLCGGVHGLGELNVGPSGQKE